MNILRAEAYLKRIADSSTVAELYDDDEMLSSALQTLFPGFEYPDFSHLTMRQVLARYNANPRSLTDTGQEPAGAQ
jgi:hypothetical protein